MLVSIVLVPIAIGILLLVRSTTYIRILASLLTLLLLLLTCFYFGSSRFTGAGIDESIMYHVKYGLSGAGYTEYIGLIFMIIFLILISLISSYSVYQLLNKRRTSKTNCIQLTAIGIFLGSFIIHPASKNMYELLLPNAYYSDLNVEDLYVTPEMQSIKKNLNIVYIYLESLEKTYFDEALFPNLVPGLKALEKESINFTNITQLPATGWTIAGMTSSQCGIPLFTSFSSNTMSGLDEFLPGAICIGDLLNEKGYLLTYMGGSSLEFAGKGKFYESHGFTNIMGKELITENLEDPDYVSGWGAYDDTLLQQAYEQFLLHSQGERPFGLFLLTLDTHHPIGHPSASCSNLPYDDEFNPILNAVHCSDLLVSDFIEKIRKSDYGDSTLIVIASDHLAMKNSAYDKLISSDRKNLFLVLPPQQKTQLNIDKRGSTIDIGPTLLSLLGYDVAGLGYGRDLMRQEPTIIEAFEYPGKMIRSTANYVSKFWDYPQLNYGLSVNSLKQIAQLGDREIKIPALIILDDKANVDKILFEFDSPKKLTDYMVKIDGSQPFVWVDFCSKVSLTEDNTVLKNDPGYCVAIGRLGGKKFLVKNIDNSFLSKNDINEVISEDQPDPDLYVSRLQRLKDYSLFGVNDVINLSLNKMDSYKGNLLIKSSGYGSGQSEITVFSDKTNKRLNSIQLKRGLSLIGITEGGGIVKLAHTDTSSLKNPVQDSVPFDGHFSYITKNLEDTFSTYLLVVHDTAIWESPEKFSNYFEGLPLKEWDRIGFRESYIAIWDKSGNNFEFHGKKEESIGVHLSKFYKKSSRINAKLKKSEDLQRIAHAGGGYKESTYTNSLEALTYNSDSYNLFEIDFVWTTDNEMVCSHDWKTHFVRTFGSEINAPTSLSEFEYLAKNNPNFTNCTLPSLIKWIDKNPNARIVTDIKSKNLQALKKIASNYPAHKNRFIPQIYQPEEYFYARKYGFKDIIWTLYKYPQDDDIVLEEVDHIDLYAVTMPRQRADRGLAKRLDKVGVQSYLHTINDIKEFEDYKMLGIDEIYTDWLPERRR